MQENIQHKQEWIVRSALDNLQRLHEDAPAVALAGSFKQLAPELVDRLRQSQDWQSGLRPVVAQALAQPVPETSLPARVSATEAVGYLEILLQHYNPLVEAVALYLMHQLDANHSRSRAVNLRSEADHPLLRETADRVLSGEGLQTLKEFPRLEKLVYLANTDLFHRMEPETLIALADRSEVKTYATGAVVTDMGDTCRELLLLLEGSAHIQHQAGDGLQVEHLQPGQILDELEVLTRSQLENTIIAGSDPTRILTVPVDTFDDLLERYPDFAPRVLELESRYLQQFVKPS